MSTPYRLGSPLNEKAWSEVKLRAMFDCCKWDIQSEDHCVLCEFPLLLERTEWQKLREMAERLSNEAITAETEILRRPELHGALGLPKAIQAVLRRLPESNSTAARVMRFDFHWAAEGWQISEVNADVPGGFNEGSGFTEIMSGHYPNVETPGDIAEAYVRAVLAHCGPNATVAMIHATAYMDDRQVMEYLGRRIAALGGRALPAAPEHLTLERDEMRLRTRACEVRIDGAIRFFPADWLPNLHGEHKWKPWFMGSGLRVSNPATSIVIQSKRFPLLWDKLETKLDAWRMLLPETKAVQDVPRQEGDWVWKPAFGRVGEGVGIEGISEGRELGLIKKAAMKNPGEWVIQRRFNALPVEHDGKPYFVTIGVYTVDGRASGAYARICEKALIDHEAQDIAVLISRGGTE